MYEVRSSARTSPMASQHANPFPGSPVWSPAAAMSDTKAETAGDSLHSTIFRRW